MLPNLLLTQISLCLAPYIQFFFPLSNPYWEKQFSPNPQPPSLSLSLSLLALHSYMNSQTHWTQNHLFNLILLLNQIPNLRSVKERKRELTIPSWVREREIRLDPLTHPTPTDHFSLWPFYVVFSSQRHREKKKERKKGKEELGLKKKQRKKEKRRKRSCCDHV